MIAHGDQRAGPAARIRRLAFGHLAVERERIGGEFAVAVDQIAFGHRRAGLVGDEDFAFGAARGGEIQDEVIVGAVGDADGDRRGRHAPLAAAIGRDQHAVCHIDEMDRDIAGLRRQFGPGADAAEMTAVLERHQRQAVRLRFLQPELDRLPPEHLPEAEIAVERGHHRVLADDADVAAEVVIAALEPVEIPRNAEQAVAVVAGEIGADEVGGDLHRLVARAAGGLENPRRDFDQPRRRQANIIDHGPPAASSRSPA